ncbi:MAG: DUF134 domain-containing protein [Nitrososphaerales archaeon]
MIKSKLVSVALYQSHLKAPLFASKEPITMTLDELEALHVVDYEGLIQEEAAIGMGVFRGIVWRCLDSAKKEVANNIIVMRMYCKDT